MAQGELTTFLCLFHDQDRADAAIKALQTAGFSAATMTFVGRRQDGADAASAREELVQLGAPHRDLDHLADGVAHGGVVLALEAEESRSDEIEGIFHRYSAAKIDEQDVSPDVAALGTAAAALPLLAESDRTVATPVAEADEVVVPIVAEELLVGKREVDRGGVRVFRHTVVEPVTEDVSLHEEHVVMERRPVDRAALPSDLGTGDQVIELIETEEVPVVSKVARVVEEVSVGVVGTDHTETVSDSVRHTEVELEPIENAPTPGKLGSQNY